MTGHPPDRRAVAVAGHVGDVDVARRGLVSDDPTVRATALGALDRIDVLSDDDLVGHFADPAAVVRRRAATIAATRAHLDLATLLDDADTSVVEVAAWACGEHEVVADAVLTRLVALATGVGAGHEPLVRESAVAALGAIGDDFGLDAVLAATSDKPAIRRRAVLALASFLDPDHERAADVAAALVRALEDRDWQVRQAAEDLTTLDD